MRRLERRLREVECVPLPYGASGNGAAMPVIVGMCAVYSVPVALNTRNEVPPPAVSPPPSPPSVSTSLLRGFLVRYGASFQGVYERTSSNFKHSTNCVYPERAFCCPGSLSDHRRELPASGGVSTGTSPDSAPDHSARLCPHRAAVRSDGPWPCYGDLASCSTC